mgnify:CR=1 FL=1
MLGLGSSIVKGGAAAKTIVTDNLVLKHNYDAGVVRQVSTGAAAMNLSSDASEHIDVGAITIGTGDISISAWVYVTAFVDEAAIFSNRHASLPNQGIELRCDTDGFEMILDVDVTGSTTVATPAKNVNQWYHVCGVWDRSGNQYMYVDGVLDVTPDDLTTRTASLAHTTTARIGRDAATSDFRGYICNVGYWNRVLSQAEVKSIMWKNYAGLTSAEKTSMVSWWNLDSVIDSTETVGVGSTTVYDNHHGDGDILGSNLVTSYEVTGSETTSRWVSYSAVSLTSSDNILTCTIGGGSDGTDHGAKYEITGLSGYTAGKTYKVKADIWLGTYVPSPTGQFRIQLGGSQKSITLSTTQTTFTVYITTSNDTDLIIFQNDADNAAGTFFISNVSIQLVNGNTGTLS